MVSHELAHQWFGDLLTCRDWSHGWLNEGFATFMERVWIENNTGHDGGMDEAKYYYVMDLKENLKQKTPQSIGRIVCNTYLEPMDLFDAHLYQKGGLVLNLIRSILGEEALRRFRPMWRATRAKRRDAGSDPRDRRHERGAICAACSTSGFSAPATPSSS